MFEDQEACHNHCFCLEVLALGEHGPRAIQDGSSLQCSFLVFQAFIQRSGMDMEAAFVASPCPSILKEDVLFQVSLIQKPPPILLIGKVKFS